MTESSPHSEPVPIHTENTGWRRTEAWFDRIADVPWGLLLALIGLVLLVVSPGRADASSGLWTAAGLFGVGHGIHRARRANP